MLDDPISRIEAALDAGPVGQFTTTRGTDAVYDFTPDDVRALLDRLKAAEGELETERMRLAACGVAALANTPKSAAAAREMLPEYRSASLDDVEHAVAEQMRLRSENERLRAENMTLRNQRDELRIILDKRPAMNEGLREAYAKWSAGVYALDWMDAADIDAACKEEGK